MKQHQFIATLFGLLVNVFFVFAVHAASVGNDTMLTTPRTAEKPQAAKPVFLDGQRIQAMIDHAHNGDVLRIPPGVYVMDTPLKMEKKSDLTLLCKGVHLKTRDLMAPVFIIKDSENINIIDGHFQHLEPLGEYQCDGPVFSIANTKAIRIMGTEINGCGAIGISANRSNDLMVYQCEIHHNTFTAFYLTSCKKVEIFDNLIHHNGQSLWSASSRSISMQGNEMYLNKSFPSAAKEAQGIYNQLRDQLKEPVLNLNKKNAE